MSVPSRAVHLAEIFTPSELRIDQRASDKDEVLALVADAASEALGEGTDRDRVLEALRAREEIGSTGFGHGIAIPHCRLEGVETFAVGLLVFSEGVDFEANDGEPVRLVFFIVGPKEEGACHVHLLAEVSRVLRDEAVRQELLGGRSTEAVCESFLRHVRDDFEPPDPRGRHLFHVVVQDEELFRDILEVLTALDAQAITVMEGRDPSSYLQRMPLFAGMLGSEADRFCRIVIATLDKRLSNEAIRRIQEITGDLHSSRRVLLTVQEVFWTAGALDW